MKRDFKLDLCLDCGRLVMPDIGGGPCEPGHRTVSQRLCDMGCGAVIGIQDEYEFTGLLVCPSCLDKAALQEPREQISQSAQSMRVVIRTAHGLRLFVQEIVGDLYVKWCMESDINFAAQFLASDVGTICEKVTKLSNVKVTYAVVGVDVLQ